MRRLRARLIIAITQNAIALGFVTLWLAGNALVLARGRATVDAFEVLLGLSTADGAWGHFYAPFTRVVVFGVLVSIIVNNVTRRYRPETTARRLAAESRDHVVVVGYTHLGERIREAMLRAGVEVVVVDSDRARVERIVHDEAPLVIGDPRDPATIAAAAVERARAVAVVDDAIEIAAVVARTVRARNPSCELILRCPDDDVGEILSRSYRARIVSTSRLIARRVVEDAQRRGIRRALVLGDNNIGRRVTRSLAERGVDARLAPCVDDPAALVGDAELILIGDDDLGKNLVRVDRIRDVAPHARVICRAFHDDAAELLTRPPFRCEVISSSRLAVDALIADGAFGTRARGIEPRRALGHAAAR